MRRSRLVTGVLALAMVATCGLRASVSVPLELHQLDTFYNLSAQRGVPISSVSNSPAGSDGRMPTGQNESGTWNIVTTNQFQGAMSFAGAPSATNWLAVSNSSLLKGTTAFSDAVARDMQRPRAYSNTSVAMVLRKAQVGALYISRRVDLSFGSPVEVPLTDESGTLLSVVKESYWEAEPYTTTGHTNSGYYWSPHARKVFAIQSGPLQVTWRKLIPYTAATVPTNYANASGTASFYTNGSSIYLLYTASYVVSGSACQPTKKMYWTEREYRVTGLAVMVPASRVAGIAFAYNANFPQTVSEEYHGPGYTSPTEGTTNSALAELRTIWYDQAQGMIYAYNLEGRVFVELLGDAKPDGQTREHLGYEIVDVVAQPNPADLAVELGERLTPPAPEKADVLFAQPVTSTDGEFVYRHTQPVSGRLNLYATRETTHVNDSMVHWLEAGVAGIKWPKVFARYDQSWPSRSGQYSHYLRTQVATEEEARSTAVQLSTENVPFIAYQDPLDRPRAKLTEDYKFYTFLDADQPVHRTLLRFTSGENVAFERVLSWLDVSLENTNVLGTVATNLADVYAYYNSAQIALNYSNYLWQLGLYNTSNQAYNTYLTNLLTWQGNYAAYTNYLTNYYAYTNQLGIYKTYTNWQANYAAYTNYLTNAILYTNYYNWTNWQAKYAAYTNYLTNYLIYSNQFAAYSAYTNWQTNSIRYTNYQSSYAAWLSQTNAYSNYLALTRYTDACYSKAPGVLTYGGVTFDGTWGWCHLNEAQFNVNGTYIIDSPLSSTLPLTNLTATFNLYIAPGTSPPSDGMSFLFGTFTNGPIYINSSLYGPMLAGEEGITNGLSICFDSYDNGSGDDAPSIMVKVNGTPKVAVLMSGVNGSADGVSCPCLSVPTDPATGQPMTLFTINGNAEPVRVELYQTGAISLWFKNVQILNNYNIGYTPRAGRFAFTSRCGGLNETHYFQALSISFNDAYGPANPGLPPTLVANPGSAPVYAVYPGSPPAVVADPGPAPLLIPVSDPRYIAYTNYVATRSRGVNTNWYLSLQDWQSNAADGALRSWALQVLFTNIATGLLTTNQYAFTNSQSFVYAAPALSSVSVSGITNHVYCVRLVLSNLTHANSYDLHLFLAGVGGRAVTLVEYPTTGSVGVSNLVVTFDDSGTAAPYLSAGFAAGTYAPRVGTLSSLLDTASTPALDYATPPYAGIPTVVANPGSAPTYAANPGNPPAVVNNPGAQPGVVAYPGYPPTPVQPPPAGLFDDSSTAPRLVAQTVYVGDRLEAPQGELGDSSYLAGFINQSVGISFHPGAYIDPFVKGFAAADQGAIIPVNAIPGTNKLEVWWFRTNTASAGPNAGNLRLGFQSIYWPTVIGTYTIQWPANPREIVLASKLGSGTLDTFEALGTIYRQNDPALPGYNPNEEHALMIAGTAYATRDDLNLTNADNYSSHPFVLVDYFAQDGRPAVSAFKVLREKPSAGYVFDYIVPAGQILQAPMPLPLLAKPVDGSGDGAVNYNTEPSHAGGDLPGDWNSRFATNELFSHYDSFTWRDRHNDFWVYRGPHAGLPILRAGSYVPASQTFIALSNATAIVGVDFNLTLHVSRQSEYLALTALETMPSWLSLNGLTLVGRPLASNVGTNTLNLVVEDLYDHSRVTNTLVLAVKASGTAVPQAPLTLACTNSYSGTVTLFSNRPPFLAASPTVSNSFTMRYYYKTEDSFDWPGQASPPPVGSIVPYLRPVAGNGQFIGDGASPNTASLEIVYRPVWPERDPSDGSKAVPVLPFGATLTKPAFDLPGVMDMKTARILYQQALAASLSNANASVVLHDGTREKTSDLNTQGLTALPSGIASDYYQGKYYFPNLPPFLGSRLFYDPNLGAHGALVFTGKYVAETMGESYLLLNVLRGSDLATAKALCPDADSDKAKWDALVDALSTAVETFAEDANKPGTYVPNPDWTAAIGIQDLAEIASDNSAVDTYAISATGPGSGYVTLIEGNGTAFTKAGDPVAMHIFRVDGTQLYLGEVKVLAASNPLSEQVTFQHTADLAGRFDDFEYEWKIGAPVDGLAPVTDATMSRYQALATGTNMPRRTLGGAGIQALSDNYVVMRYRPTDPAHPLCNQWSEWTTPKLAEGWIKRVLAGINPFNQRATDLFNNQVSTDASMLTQAGKRWEGDVALNLDTMNNYGLIEIYETVLRRGRMLSIESGYNYGPANDALLLAAGYLHDLYMMVGGEAWADAANPTIGIGTKDKTYGDIATALFAFKGQTGSLLEEELALLRGRDDFLAPGVQTAPVYNRLVWNYTRGIDSGEVIYALNYNIQPASDNATGSIGAADAAKMFPQGHGDAYGHYLTALKGYYSLLLNSYFDWVPRIEAVNVLGQPVSVDYQDERKFAAAAAAVARTGRQIFDLTWRRDFQSVATAGWSHFGATRINAQRQYLTPGGTTNYVTRYWGMDHWAARSGQGTYLNWIVGNSMLPDVDPNPLHEGIQKIDRTTVPELTELVTTGEGLQTAMDNAEGGLSPLGVPEGGITFDLNPSVVVGTDNGTHFEQVYQRAKLALNNAVVSFDDAKDVTRLMRSEQDSLADFQAQVAKQEQAYKNSLIELYGTPYPEDIGPGKTWVQGYSGPDLVHYMYVDLPEVDWGGGNGNEFASFRVDVQTLPPDWFQNNYTDLNFVTLHNDSAYTNKNATNFIEYVLGPHGFYDKPSTWAGTRASPGRLQQAISELIAAHDRLRKGLDDAQGDKQDFDKAVRIFRASVQTHDQLRSYEKNLLIAEQTLASVEHAFELVDVLTEHTEKSIELGFTTAKDALPQTFIAGLAAGGDLTAPARSAMEAAGITVTEVMDWTKILSYIGVSAFGFANDTAARWTEFDKMAPLEWEQELRSTVVELGNTINDLNDHMVFINRYLRAYDDARRKYRALVAEGDRLQQERQIFRQRAAQIVQGYRTRDAAFRLFRNEKLERYKTLFDLAARYSLLAANAYDYETGLLNTDVGQSFKKRIINSRALGVVRSGEPQYAGSDSGDPGLSSALAEMKADWDVLRGRLGFNNPDAYGTTFSLRTEALRILPTSDGDATWKDVLQGARVSDILADTDVRRYCMQVDDGSGLPVPGIVLTFSSTIANGYNFFGKELAAGDHTFTPSSFATKIFGAGVALIGYRGMDDPSANSSSTSSGTSPSDPTVTSLDPLALAATPYVYLIPVGVDSMRSPPLGDSSTIRTWTVEDVAIPMPFNIGASDFSTKQLWQTSDSLTEPLFTVRKHQGFRPVSTTAVFNSSLYGSAGTLKRSQFMNNRLVGRSVWNSQWKLVIPGRTLLNNPNEGLDRFIQTVTDVRLHLVTYSYSGN